MDLPSVHIPSSRSREWKSICGVHDVLTSSRTKMINNVRGWLRGRASVRRNGSSEHAFHADHPFIAAQRRSVAHSSDKARRLLGYTAPVSYDEGLSLTEAWLREARILDANAVVRRG